MEPEQPPPAPLCITAEDARSWGAQAFEMGLTLKRAREDISYCGCPDRLLSLVDETYNRAKERAIFREIEEED